MASRGPSLFGWESSVSMTLPQRGNSWRSTSPHISLHPPCPVTQVMANDQLYQRGRKGDLREDRVIMVIFFFLHYRNYRSGLVRRSIMWANRRPAGTETRLTLL